MTQDTSTTAPSPRFEVSALRRTVLLVAGLNAAYFALEGLVALAIGSVSLLADSVDFLEDAAVNTIIALALSWSLARRARVGKIMALVILAPAIAALVQAGLKIADPTAPDTLQMTVTAGGGAVINLLCAGLLTRVRDVRGSLTTAAYLAARNDVFINLGVIVAALVTRWWSHDGWPDVVFGLLILGLNGFAAKEVWEVASEEQLAAKALAGEEIEA